HQIFQLLPYTTLFRSQPTPAKEEPLNIKKEVAKDTVQIKPQSSSNLPLDKIKQIFDNHDTEWVSVASLGSQWKLLQVDFDPRTRSEEHTSELQSRETL